MGLWRLAQSAETGCEDCGDGFGARRFSCGFSHVGVGVGARFFMRTSRSGDGSAGGRAAVGGVGGVQSPAAVVCSPNRKLQNGGDTHSAPGREIIGTAFLAHSSKKMAVER